MDGERRPLSADIVVSGPPVPAIERLRYMSDVQWEDFVTEWVDSLRDEYRSVDRFAGSGDMGCDIVAMHLEDPDKWDNYQCKHYNHALYPSDAWVELGKLVYYTYTEEFSYPAAYYFVAPRGVGTSLSRLLRKPEELKAELAKNWAVHCERGICATAVPLDSELKSYLDTLDFSIFSAASPLKVIEQHARTRWHAARFGGGLPERPDVQLPPTAIATEELFYVVELLLAYSDHLHRELPDLQSVEDPDLLEHFHDSRIEFYSAEALRLYCRETLPPGEYSGLQQEVFEGIRDEVRSTHSDAYARVLSVVQAAKNLPLANHPLVSRVNFLDRGGICHQLVNDRRIKWVK